MSKRPVKIQGLFAPVHCDESYCCHYAWGPRGLYERCISMDQALREGTLCGWTLCCNIGSGCSEHPGFRLPLPFFPLFPDGPVILAKKNKGNPKKCSCKSKKCSCDSSKSKKI